MGMRLDFEITGRIQRMLFALENPDFSEFMKGIRTLIEEEHVKGVMAGIGADGLKLTPVTYRDAKAIKIKKGTPLKNLRFGGPHPIPANDNLATAEYKKLEGPPLAPRGLQSRVIRNYVSKSGYDGRNWFVESALIDIVNPNDKPFMQYHFDGEGHLPKRDLRGLRPATRDRIMRLLSLEIRRQFFEGI